jgi:hypothetical protein
MSPGVIGSRDAAARVHEHPHGTRRRYQTGCRCPACTTANTAYSAQYKQAARAGRPLLGAHVAGTEAARVIAALVDEGYPKSQIATWLGHRWPVLHWRRGAGVTVRTVLRLRVIQRRVCG